MDVRKALATAAAILGLGLGLGPAAAEGTHPLAHQAAPAAAGGDFTLRSADGPVSLRQFRGKVAVLYFGYTLCPDICPTTLSVLAQALGQLSPAERARVQPIVITLDPARDDAQRLATYARFFHPSMIGLTGADDRIAVVARQYGVLYGKQAVESASHYVVDHSSFLSIVGPDGRLLDRLAHGASATEILAALRAALPAAPVAVADPRVRLLPDAAANTSAFMTLTNRGERELRLVGAESPVAERIELHRLVRVDDLLARRPVEAIPLRAKAETALAPGGYQLVLVGLRRPLHADDEVPIRLAFDDGSVRDVTAAVRPIAVP